MCLPEIVDEALVKQQPMGLRGRVLGLGRGGLERAEGSGSLGLAETTRERLRSLRAAELRPGLGAALHARHRRRALARQLAHRLMLVAIVLGARLLRWADRQTPRRRRRYDVRYLESHHFFTFNSHVYFLKKISDTTS